MSASHGRGGAGNISSATPELDVASLTTPTIKNEIFTTGRGGSGNMISNNDPEATRRAQDVEAVVRRESTTAAHVGRGGAGNIETGLSKQVSGSTEAAAESSAQLVQDHGAPETKGWADKGKAWLKGKIVSAKTRITKSFGNRHRGDGFIETGEYMGEGSFPTAVEGKARGRPKFHYDGYKPVSGLESIGYAAMSASTADLGTRAKNTINQLKSSKSMMFSH